MDIARGGSFAKGDKKSKAKTSTRDGEKKNEPQSKISRLKELTKSLYRNDFTRLLTPFKFYMCSCVIPIVCIGA